MAADREVAAAAGGLSMETIQKIPGMVKDLGRHVKPLSTWLASSEPNAQLPRETLVALGKSIVGTTDSQIKAYISEDPKGKTDALKPEIVKKIVNNPQQVLNFIYNLPENEIATILKSNSAAMGQIQAALTNPKILESIAPTITLSAVFKKSAEDVAKLSADVKKAFTEGIGDPGNLVSAIDKPQEIGEFISLLSKTEVQKFIEQTREQSQKELDKAGWTGGWKYFAPNPIDIKIDDKDWNDPAKIQNAITNEITRFQNALPKDKQNEVMPAIRTGIQTNIQSSLNDLKSGKIKIPEQSPEQIAKHLHPLFQEAKKDPKHPNNKLFLDMISTPVDPNNPDSPKQLAAAFHSLLTVSNIMKNKDTKDALVETFIPEGVAQTLGQFKSMLQMLDQFIPGLGKMLTSLVDAALPYVNDAARKLEEASMKVHTPAATQTAATAPS